MNPYRNDGSAPRELKCPRCAKPLPPLDVARCAKGCGTWVSLFAATEVLTKIDRKPDPVTRWWRVRAPCPVCSDKMALCGANPGYLQGCAIHGYFIDADTIQHTGLARGVDEAALERKRNDPDRVDAERIAVLQEEEARAQRKAEDQARAAELDARFAARQREIAETERRASLRREIEASVRAGTGGMLAELVVKLVDRVTALEARVTELENR